MLTIRLNKDQQILISCLLVTIIVVPKVHAEQAWEWTPVSDIDAPGPRHGHAAVWTGSEMIIWGGFDSSGALGDGARYNPATDTWTPMSNINAPSARGYCAAVWTGSAFFIWGGALVLATSYLTDGALYDPSNDTWAPLMNINPPPQRDQMVYVWTGQEVIVGGGQDESSGRCIAFRDYYAYDLTSGTWLRLRDFPGAARHTILNWCWTGKKIVIWGGKRPIYKDLDNGAIYDPQSGYWTSMSPSPLGRRCMNVTTCFNGEVFIWGGERVVETYLSDGARYDLATGQWRSVDSSANAPSPRRGALGIFAGSKIVVWGGRSRDYYNNGAEYYPQYDPSDPPPWKEITATDPPSARIFGDIPSASAVWTGESVIIWGGKNASGVLGDGKIYGPANKPLAANIDIDPDTLNLKSNGKWITCFIELPEGYDVWQIDGSTVVLDRVIPAYLGKQGWAKAESNDSNIMDHDGDGILERMVKFDRQALVEYLDGVTGDVTLTVTGEVAGTPFEGTIRSRL